MSIEKSCLSCSHYKTCRFREAREELQSQMDELKEKLPEGLSLLVECEYKEVSSIRQILQAPTVDYNHYLESNILSLSDQLRHQYTQRCIQESVINQCCSNNLSNWRDY